MCFDNRLFVSKTEIIRNGLLRDEACSNTISRRIIQFSAVIHMEFMCHILMNKRYFFFANMKL